MKTEVLREFIVLAQYLNYSIAAEKIHIAQPRLSVHITELEREIGFPLFAREKPLSLTAEGKRFLSVADKVLGELDAAIANGVKTSRCKSESITIMKPPLMEQFPPSIPQGLSRALDEMNRLFVRFSSAMPSTCNTRSEFDVLLENKSDLCYVLQCDAGEDSLIEAAQNKIVVRTLYEISFVAWVNERHPLSTRSTVSLTDVADFPVIVPGSLEISTYRKAVEGFFRTKGLAPVFRTVFTDTASAYLVSPPKEEEVIVTPDYLDLGPTLGLTRLDLSDAPSASIALAHLETPKNPLAKQFVDIVLAQPY